jgi:hypothetical protein
MFAGIMGIAVVLFTLMSWNYKYVEEIKMEEKKRLSAVSNHKSDSSSSSSSDSDDEKGKENKGFSE